MNDIKGIVPIPQGGLGNQIFIVVAGLIASNYHNCPLYLPNNTNCNNSHSKKEYKHSIFKYIGTHIDCCFMSVITGRQYNRHFLDIFHGFEPWTVESAPAGTYLESYYQYYPTLEPYESVIREKLLLGLEPYRKKLREIYDFRNTAFCHIRRGDYVHFSDRHYLQPISYYRYCIKNLLEKKPNIKKIYVLSDDIDWIRNCSLYTEEYKEICEIYENDDEIESLSFMSLCEDGSICANSTYSWWGAYLGSFSKRNPVFVPSKWMKTESQIKLFPKEWIIVPENV